MELSDPSDLYAVAYRLASGADPLRIESWPIRVHIGQSLPTLPLWLDAECAVPVELEQSYQATCETLRIKVA